MNKNTLCCQSALSGSDNAGCNCPQCELSTAHHSLTLVAISLFSTVPELADKVTVLALELSSLIGQVPRSGSTPGKAVLEKDPNTGDYDERDVLHTWLTYSAIRTTLHLLNAQFPHGSKTGARFVQMPAAIDFFEIDDLEIEIEEITRNGKEERPEDFELLTIGTFKINPDFVTGTGNGLFRDCQTVTDALKIARRAVGGK